MNPLAIIVGLVDAEIAFVVVGMTAGLIYGSRSLTEDVDIVYQDEPSNIERLAGFLRVHEANVLELGPNEGFSSEFSAERLFEDKRLSLSTRFGEIDVFDRIRWRRRIRRSSRFKPIGRH